MKNELAAGVLSCGRFGCHVLFEERGQSDSFEIRDHRHPRMAGGTVALLDSDDNECRLPAFKLPATIRADKMASGILISVDALKRFQASITPDGKPNAATPIGLGVFATPEPSIR